MHALTVLPGRADSAQLDLLPEPTADGARVLLRALDIGVCGTDREILAGKYGTAPPGQKRLILGHESLGEVLRAPEGARFAAGDLAVAFVRRPDPLPCPACARGEWDMCKNGRYTERGIKERHGYAAEQYTVRPEFLVPVPAALRSVGVLVEPTSVVAKAWEQIERIGARATTAAQRVMVTGCGPIGLLAALLGRQRGLDVHVFDRHRDGLKPELARALGATYHCGDLDQLDLQADIVLECTGAPGVVIDAVRHLAPDGIVCLTGVSSGGRRIGVDVGRFNRELVLENGVVFGSVNANRRHYIAAVDALARADRAWLERLITRRVPLARWREAFTQHPEDVKTVLDFANSAHAY